MLVPENAYYTSIVILFIAIGYYIFLDAMVNELKKIDGKCIFFPTKNGMRKINLGRFTIIVGGILPLIWSPSIIYPLFALLALAYIEILYKQKIIDEMIHCLLE